MRRNINRTLDNGSSVFTYTPENAWGFLKDDGSTSGNMGVLDDYLNTGSKEVARSTLEKRQTKAGNTSIAVTDSSASVDLTFKGMSTSLDSLMEGSAVYVYGISGPQCGQARVKLDDTEVAKLNMTVRPIKLY
jgi:hypothetical protein